MMKFQKNDSKLSKQQRNHSGHRLNDEGESCGALNLLVIYDEIPRNLGILRSVSYICFKFLWNFLIFSLFIELLFMLFLLKIYFLIVVIYLFKIIKKKFITDKILWTLSFINGINSGKIKFVYFKIFHNFNFVIDLNKTLKWNIYNKKQLFFKT